MKTTVHTIGWLFIVTGAIGLVLPFVHGIALIAFGIAFISFLSPRTQQKIEFFQKVLGRYWPAAAKFLVVFKQKCDTVLLRITRWRKKK